MSRCANFEMTDYNHFDKELTFENTPLQNLKNILSSTEASIAHQEAAPQASGSIKALGQERPGVVKQDIRKAIEYLDFSQGKYVSVAVIGRIASQLCAAGERAAVPMKDFSTNIYINRLNEIIPINTLHQGLET